MKLVILAYAGIHILQPDISQHLDVSTARLPELEQKRVNVDFPVWMIHQLDKEAKRIGVTRQSIIKMWLAEHLKEVA